MGMTTLKRKQLRHISENWTVFVAMLSIYGLAFSSCSMTCRRPIRLQFQWLLHAYHQIQVEEDGRILHVDNPPAAMDVHLLLPEEVTFHQTDRYDPEPESTQGRWQNTWHLTASTKSPDRTGQFLAVLLPYRKQQGQSLPSVESLLGRGCRGRAAETHRRIARHRGLSHRYATSRGAMRWHRKSRLRFRSRL